MIIIKHLHFRLLSKNFRKIAMYRLNSLNADIQLTVDGDRQVISLSRLANTSGFLCIFVEDKLHLGNAIVQAHCYCSRFALSL